jgi:hypothetical protein
VYRKAQCAVKSNSHPKEKQHPLSSGYDLIFNLLTKKYNTNTMMGMDMMESKRNTLLAELELDMEKKKMMDIICANKKKNSNNNRRRKVVHFNNEVIINEVPTHRSLTLNERSSIWYTGIDYRCFILLEQTSNSKTGYVDSKVCRDNNISANNVNKSYQNNNYYDCDNRTERSKRIEHIRCIVLQAQYQLRQNKNGIDDENRNDNNNDEMSSSPCCLLLKDLYQYYSATSTKAARQRALDNDKYNINNMKIQEYFQRYTTTKKKSKKKRFRSLARRCRDNNGNNNNNPTMLVVPTKNNVSSSIFRESIIDDENNSTSMNNNSTWTSSSMNNNNTRSAQSKAFDFFLL